MSFIHSIISLPMFGGGGGVQPLGGLGEEASPVPPPLDETLPGSWIAWYFRKLSTVCLCIDNIVRYIFYGLLYYLWSMHAEYPGRVLEWCKISPNSSVYRQESLFYTRTTLPILRGDLYTCST